MFWLDNKVRNRRTDTISLNFIVLSKKKKNIHSLTLFDDQHVIHFGHVMIDWGPMLSVSLETKKIKHLAPPTVITSETRDLRLIRSLRKWCKGRFTEYKQLIAASFSKKKKKKQLIALAFSFRKCSSHLSCKFSKHYL